MERKQIGLLFRNYSKIPIKSTATINTVHSSNQLLIPITLPGNRNIPLQLDTGSEVCLLSDDLFRLLPNYNEFPVHPRNLVLLDHQGNVIPQVTSPRVIPISIGKQQFFHPFHITGDKGTCLGGLCLLSDAKLNIVHDNGSMKVLLGPLDNPTDVIMPLPSSFIAHVYVAHDVVLDPGHIHQVKVLIRSPLCCLQ